MKFCLAYEMDGEPSDGMEVFSSTEILEKNISDKQILGKAIGVRKEDWSRRSDRAFKFIDAEIATKLLNHFSPKTGSQG